MAEITPSAVSDISPNQGMVSLILTVTPTNASTNTVVIPSNRMKAINMALVQNITDGVVAVATWSGRTITLTGVGAGGVGDEHTILAIGI